MKDNIIHQDVVFIPEAHQKLLEGAKILNDAVRTTLGPSGHSVILDTNNGAPIITKDGVTVAKSINLKDRLRAMGANLLKEIAEKTNADAGDGTTSSVVLAYSMLSEGIKMIATGRSSVYLKRGMELATEEVINYLKENCIPVASKEDIINVGTISANGDRSIGELIAMAIEKVGKDGIVTIEPAKSVQTTLEFVEGMQLDNSGYISPFFITNSEKGTCELENPYVLITPNKISSLADIISILEGVVKNNSKSLLIIADDVEGDALHTLIVNKTKGILKVCAVKAPSYGEFRADILSDLSVIVGGNVFGASSAIALKNSTVEHLGTCKKAIIGRNNTTIIGNSDEQRKLSLEERISSIRSLLSDNASTLDALHVDKYKKRLAHLSGGIAVIHVGGSTEVEINEKKDRVEDAVNATIAATQEGIVPGGGIALFYAGQHIRALMKDFKDQPTNFSNNINIAMLLDNEDIVAGIELIAKVCEAPFSAIIENTGISPAVVAEHIKNNYREFNEHLYKDTKNPDDKAVVNWFLKTKGMSAFRLGYNATTGKYCDLVEDGVVDPCLVTRAALQNSVSIIGLILSCNAVIVNSEEIEI